MKMRTGRLRDPCGDLRNPLEDLWGPPLYVMAFFDDEDEAREMEEPLGDLLEDPGDLI